MKHTTQCTIPVALLLLLTVSFVSAQTASTQTVAPELKTRYLKATGLDPDKIVQHYYLVKNGGVIELAAKDPNDTATATAIMKYLEAQRQLFEKGKNDTAIEIHGKTPDGYLGIRKLRNEITFYPTKNDTGTGGVLRMFSVNPEAKKAIQDFLKFQITEFQTGDSPTENQ